MEYSGAGLEAHLTKGIRLLTYSSGRDIMRRQQLAVAWRKSLAKRSDPTSQRTVLALALVVGLPGGLFI